MISLGQRASRVRDCRSSACRRLPIQLKRLREQPVTKAAGSARDGGCGSSARRRSQEQRETGPREQLERLRVQRVTEAAGAVRTDCRSSGWGRVGCSLRRWLLEWRVPVAAGSARDRGHSINPGRGCAVAEQLKAVASGAPPVGGYGGSSSQWLLEQPGTNAAGASRDLVVGSAWD